MLPTAVKHLIIINTLAYLTYYVIGPFQHIFNINAVCGLWSIDSGYFRIWQPITYMFMHGNFSHLFFNMFALWMFGGVLENFWGTRRFLFYYMACGIGAAVLYLLIPGLSLTVGASAAVYGLLLAFGMTFPNEYIYLYFLVPIKAKWFVIGYAVIELYEGFFVTDNIAHFAHLSGMLIGLIILLWWRRHPFSRL